MAGVYIKKQRGSGEFSTAQSQKTLRWRTDSYQVNGQSGKDSKYCLSELKAVELTKMSYPGGSSQFSHNIQGNCRDILHKQ